MWIGDWCRIPIDCMGWGHTRIVTTIRAFRVHVLKGMEGLTVIDSAAQRTCTVLVKVAITVTHATGHARFLTVLAFVIDTHARRGAVMASGAFGVGDASC